MKTAKAYTDAIAIECPYCHELITEPNSGSQMWALDDVTAHGREVECHYCGESSLIPKRYFKENVA